MSEGFIEKTTRIEMLERIQNKYTDKDCYEYKVLSVAIEKLKSEKTIEYNPEKLFVIVDKEFNIMKIFDDENDANIKCNDMQIMPASGFEVCRLSLVGNVAYNAGHEAGFESGYNDGKEEAEDCVD